MKKEETISLQVEDMSGQREFRAREVPRDASWGETLQSIVAKMHLPKNNPTGTNVWRGRLDRESRHLHASEIVGQALQEGDKVVLEPEVRAG